MPSGSRPARAVNPGKSVRAGRASLEVRRLPFWGRCGDRLCTQRVSGNPRPARVRAPGAPKTGAQPLVHGGPSLVSGLPLRARGEAMIGPVDKALVLAAGNGDRFRNPTRESKLLQPVLGRRSSFARSRPRTTQALRRSRSCSDIAPIASALRSSAGAARRRDPFTHNPDWHLENGVSALGGASPAAIPLRTADGRPPVRGARAPAAAARDGAPGESLLAVDSRPATREVADEATKVRLRGSRIIAIGKALTDTTRSTPDCSSSRLRSSARSSRSRAAGRYDAERRHQNSRGARADAGVRHRRRDLVRHRHRLGSRSAESLLTVRPAEPRCRRCTR